MRGYLINKVAGKRPLFIDNDTLNNEACQQALQSKPEEVRQSIFIHPKIYDVIALLEELQTVNVDKRVGQLAEVALRHGIAISNARQIYDNACQLFTDDRLILGAPTGHKNQKVLVTALDRAYQMSIDDSDRLESFMNIFSNASHWQIRAYSEQAVRNVKKELGLDSLIRIGARENFHGYEVRVVQKKRKRSDNNLAITDEYYSSSGVLKYLGCLLYVLANVNNNQ